MWHINYLAPSCDNDCTGHEVQCDTIQDAMRTARMSMESGTYETCDVLDDNGTSYGPFTSLTDIRHAYDMYL